MFSPLTITLMIHVYAICVPIENRNASAVEEALEKLQELGLIREVDGEHTGVRASGFEATPKGQAWVGMICATPPPEMQFLDPRTY